MKPKKQSTQEGKMPPGKEEAPKPQPGKATNKPVGGDDSSVKPEGQEPEEHAADNEVIAPDGEPDPKKEPAPLF
jgi:hypothetical protein